MVIFFWLSPEFDLSIFDLGRVKWKCNIMFALTHFNISKNTRIDKSLVEQAPNTFARDLLILHQSGYEFNKIITIRCLVGERFVESGLKISLDLLGKRKVWVVNDGGGHIHPMCQ